MANITRHNQGSVMPQNEWDPFRLMREMLRFDPFREMAPYAAGEETGQVFQSRWEVKETKDAYIFKADLPGVKEKDIDISLTGNRLTVSGKREAAEREQNETWYAYERSFGSFTRSFTLPEGTNDDVQAELKDGVLTLVVHKKPELQPKKIAVKAGNVLEGKAKA